MSSHWADVFVALMRELARQGGDAWLVGGCLRDALLGVPVDDVDIATTADPLELAEALRSRFGASVALLPRSVRVAVTLPGASDAARVDIAALKSTTIEDDLRQRDFTVNALALPLHAWRALQSFRGVAIHADAMPDLIDPTGGCEDLDERRLRVASQESFLQDAGRVIRGARLLARYGFTPTDETITLARDAAELLRSLSADRSRDELNLLFATARCAEGFHFLDNVGAVATLLPELANPRAITHALASLRSTAALQEPADPDVDIAPAFTPDSPIGRWYTTHQPGSAPRIVALRWGLLLHAATPHDSESAAEAKHDTTGVAPGFRRFVRGPERRIIYEVEARAGFTARTIAYREPDERDLRRLFASAGDTTVDVLVGAAACALGFAEQGILFDGEAHAVVERVQRILDLYFTDPARLIPPPLLTGRDLIRELGVEPGIAIHRLLMCVRDAQIDGRVTTHEEALALARETLGA